MCSARGGLYLLARLKDPQKFSDGIGSTYDEFEAVDLGWMAPLGHALTSTPSKMLMRDFKNLEMLVDVKTMLEEMNAERNFQCWLQRQKIKIYRNLEYRTQKLDWPVDRYIWENGYPARC
ncbi:hypothetical protein BG011_008123, partial [Mortierella polycephala]